MEISWIKFFATSIGQKATFIVPSITFEIDVIIRSSRVDFDKESTCYVEFRSVKSDREMIGRDFQKIKELKWGQLSILRYEGIDISCSITNSEIDVIYLVDDNQTHFRCFQGGVRIELDKHTCLTGNIGERKKEESKKILNRFKLLDI